MLRWHTVPCVAQIEPTSFEVAVRTLRFVAEPPKGETAVAIIFAPSDPKSVMEAEDLRKLLGSGLDVGDATLVPVLVDIDRLDDLQGMRFAFLAGDLKDHQEAVFEATRTHGVLSISTRSECVESGLCVLAVKVRPRVEVIVSRAAAAASSVEFATAFRMLIKEI